VAADQPGERVPATARPGSGHQLGVRRPARQVIHTS